VFAVDWWCSLFEKSKAVHLDAISPMDCHRQAWMDWLTCDNEYAQGDCGAMEAGGFELMNLIQIELKVV